MFKGNSSSSQASLHQFAGTVLFVGDGDFGLSDSLVKSRQDGSNIVATSFQSYDEVIRMYKEAPKHIGNLLTNGSRVLFEVDARAMINDPRLTGMCFDRIIFSFPHAGFGGAETDRRVIQAHRALMSSFFMNAAQMLTLQGEVHVIHQTNYPYHKWNLPQLANDAGLEHFDTRGFYINDYPGYENKRGAGRHADRPFKLGDSAMFKFKKIN